MDKKQSWPEWVYPEWRVDSGLLSPERWLQGKQECDGAEGLWRVHDGLYDLSLWIHSHPGGAQWLQDTKGTDITEAFESHHLSPLATKILPNFYVRKANAPRNSPFTFKDDGFFRMMKSRVYEKLKHVPPGPSRHSKMLLDSLATSTIVLSVLAALYQSFLLGFVAGMLLTMTTICSHNFFHQRDSWRMYLFNMSLFTVRHWRISHALSHHLYPNTHYDLEISMFEPFLKYIPSSEKSKIWSRLSVIYSPFIYPFITLAEGIKRTLTTQPQPQDLIGFLLPTVTILIGGVSVLQALKMWIFITLVGSFFFGVIGVNVAHHHPDIFHYGDKPNKDRDWGIFSLAATRDRIEVYGSPNLVLLTFGDHCLHHLFPTIDHVHLHSLYPILEQTCKEFGIKFKMMTTLDLLLGQFRQLMRREPNLKEPLCD
ncbi:cytochrome b5-related protein-like isoform X2 [Macrosteles quadrilineatus]|nr:cytochrome b5-related protein-like isoform X2 [Macrosteles quadrilineatus]